MNSNLVHQIALHKCQTGDKLLPIQKQEEKFLVEEKPWRQKGTGKARHGSIRSPIWVGGGVTC